MKLVMYMYFTIPIFQFVGLFGSLWSIAVVLMSNNISFVKTKHFYATVFAADIVANLSMMGIEKSTDFIVNFNHQFIVNMITNNSDIICKISKLVF